MALLENFSRMTTPVVKRLIIINVIVWVFTKFTGNLMYEYMSLFYVGSPLFHPYQIITHLFMHGDFFHIFFNMYTLWLFGCILENMWGSRKFLLYYFVTGLGAAGLHELVMYIQSTGMDSQALVLLNSTPTVGASGAIFGLLIAYGMLFPNNVLTLIFPPVSLKAKYFVLIFAGIELFFGVAGIGGNVAHFAHLGGALFGWLLMLYWKKTNRMYH